MRILITIAALLFAVGAHAQGTGPMRPDQNIPFTGQVRTPSCTLSTTTGNISVTAAPPCASASSQGVAWNVVGPLTGNATLQFPTGLLDGFSMGFLINHGTGGYTLSFASGYIFPNAALTANQPNLTNTADAVDLVVCQSVNAPLPGTTTPNVLSMWCGSPPLAMTAAGSAPTVPVSGHAEHNSGTGGTQTTTVAVTVPTTVTGSQLAVFTGGCNTNACTGLGSAITGVSGTGLGSCSAFSTVGNSLSPTTDFTINAWHCAVTSGGTNVVVTATLASPGQAYLSIAAVTVVGVTTDSAVGTIAGQTGTALTVTSGSTSAPAAMLAVAFLAGPIASYTPTTGPPAWTALDSDLTTAFVDQYLIQSAAGAAVAAGTSGSSVKWGMTVVGLQ